MFPTLIYRITVKGQYVFVIVSQPGDPHHPVTMSRTITVFLKGFDSKADYALTLMLSYSLSSKWATTKKKRLSPGATLYFLPFYCCYMHFFS